MKRLLLIALPLILIVGCDKPVEDSTLINKDGLMYLPESDKPYTGEVFFNYDTGEKLYQGTYDKGLLVQYSYLNKDGSVKEPINYEETLNERDGVFYTKDWNKPYSGPVFSLDDKGRNRIEGILEYGKMVRYKEITYRYENGQKTEEFTFKNGKLNGPVIFYHENGQKMSEGTYKDNNYDGLFLGWGPDGQKTLEMTYKDGKADGLVTRWYWPNGQKEFEVTYKDGKVISKKEWNQDGSVADSLGNYY